MRKSDRVIIWLGAGVLAVLVLAGISEGRKASGQPSDDGDGAVGISAHVGLQLSDDLSRPDLCQPSDIEDPVTCHPLYRRPARPRPAHSRLVQSGWSSWYLDPPSED